MPRVAYTQTPKYRRHRADGQAVVTLSGQDHYLGPFGSRTIRQLYDRLVGEWLAAGRVARRAKQAGDLTVVELCAAFLRHAKSYYIKQGEITSQVSIVTGMITRLRPLYGKAFVSEFGPLALQAFQNSLVAEGLARATINHFTGAVTQTRV